MIFYFSGTGNSQWVAEQLGALTGDQVQDILKLDKAPSLSGETQVGFVFPVYAWGVPQPMLDFVKSLPKTNGFSFGVCTCGEEAGLAMKKTFRSLPFGEQLQSGHAQQLYYRFGRGRHANCYTEDPSGRRAASTNIPGDPAPSKKLSSERRRPSVAEIQHGQLWL